jgi:hypothetical protein
MRMGTKSKHETHLCFIYTLHTTVGHFIQQLLMKQGLFTANHRTYGVTLGLKTFGSWRIQDFRLPAQPEK